MAKKATAKKKYAKKVCEKYLGISKSGCKSLFEDKLFPNMKAGIKAAA